MEIAYAPFRFGEAGIGDQVGGDRCRDRGGEL